MSNDLFPQLAASAAVLRAEDLGPLADLESAGEELHEHLCLICDNISHGDPDTSILENLAHLTATIQAAAIFLLGRVPESDALRVLAGLQ